MIGVGEDGAPPFENGWTNAAAAKTTPVPVTIFTLPAGFVPTRLTLCRNCGRRDVDLAPPRDWTQLVVVCDVCNGNPKHWRARLYRLVRRFT